MFGLFKKREIELASMIEFEKTLTSMIQILRDNGFGGQAGTVSNVLSYLLLEEKDEFIKRLNSVDMWGGAGAVWEVSDFRTRGEEIEFWTLIIDLTDKMKEVGMINKRAFSTAETFKRNSRRDVNISGC